MKKLIMMTVLSAGLLKASAIENSEKSGKVIIAVSLTVGNYNEWKRTFDAGAPVREKAGIKVLQVCSLAENENQVLVIEEAASLQSATEFIDVVKKRQKSTGITNIDFRIYKPR